MASAWLASTGAVVSAAHGDSSRNDNDPKQDCDAATVMLVRLSEHGSFIRIRQVVPLRTPI